MLDKNQFTLEQLRTFAATVECRSFSAAARILGKAQSAVSTAMTNLEIDLGVELFDRSGKFPVLTDAGVALLRDAHRILNLAKEMQGRANGLQAGEELQLTIVIDDFVPVSMLAELFTGFEKEFPYIELELLFAGLEDATELIRSGRAQMGLMIPIDAMEPDLRFDCHQIGTMEYLPVAHVDHPLASMKQITMDELALHRQLVSTGRNITGPLYVKWMHGRQLWRVESHFAIYDLVRTGVGWATLPEHIVKKSIENGSFVVLDLGFKEVSEQLPFYLIKNKGVIGGKGCQWLTNELTQIVIE
ncbi:MAG: LysR family transcriptional regulator [Desulfovibrio sp.]